MIIAIDGPAASGKGTLGKRLAHHYGFRHLDTGVIYRAVAKALLDIGADLTDEASAVAVAMELDPEKFGHPELKTQRVGEAASVVSAIPSVRKALVSFQRKTLERFQAKWIPVRVKKMRQNKKLEPPFRSERKGL